MVIGSAGIGIGITLMFVLGLLVYFIPSIVAERRSVPNAGSVLVINIFLGWTLIGWIVALALASRSQPAGYPPHAGYVPWQAGGYPPGGYQPYAPYPPGGQAPMPGQPWMQPPPPGSVLPPPGAVPPMAPPGHEGTGGWPPQGQGPSEQHAAPPHPSEPGWGPPPAPSGPGWEPPDSGSGW